MGLIASTKTWTGEFERVDGAFGKPHEVGQYVEKWYGKVKSVRITRSGVVIIDCSDAEQMEKALRTFYFGERKAKVPVRMFRIGEGARRKGVISGVPLDIRPFLFEDKVEGVCDARR